VIEINKKVGETPLQALDRLRIEKPELQGERLSYAGRLDPMAEGVMLVLIGDENQDYKNHLEYDKEYIATFMLGVGTDTFDALGMITDELTISLTDEEIKKQIEEFKNVNVQTYPWFSAQTVDGIKLFDHFKAGNTSITRPTLDVEVYESEILKIYKEPLDPIVQYIKEHIKLVDGDFRQEEILNKWEDYYKEHGGGEEMVLVDIRLKVSSGTYIRALVEEFSVPAILLKLKRTKIYN